MVKTLGGTVLPRSKDVLRGDSVENTRVRFALHLPLPLPDAGDCWEWQGHRCPSNGYGYFYFVGCFMGAHRVSYAIKTGRWPGKWQVRHLCGNRACVNPAHLRRGTRSQNERGKQKRRRFNWKNQHGRG